MTQNNEPKRVMWSFDIVSESVVPEFARTAPNEHMFQLSFPNQEAAELFVAEIQRYIGGLLINLANSGIRLQDRHDSDQ